MTDPLSQEINDILVDAFHAVLKYEERALEKLARRDLTITEVHILEAIGRNRNEPKSMGDLAAALEIRPPSVTAAVGKLAKKGYAEKLRGGHDARVVYAVLTRRGLKVDAMHRYFHEKMVRAVVRNLSEPEKEIMLRALRNLNSFFRKRTEPDENGGQL